jgi:hypothetical protein
MRKNNTVVSRQGSAGREKSTIDDSIQIAKRGDRSGRPESNR